MSNRTGFRLPLSAYPDTIMALRWRGLHTVMHDVPGTADPDQAAQIEGRPQ